MKPRRAELFSLALMVGMVIGAVGDRPCAAQEPNETIGQAGSEWNLGRLPAGRVAPTSITATNRSCRGRRDFAIAIEGEASRFLRLTGPERLEGIGRGESRTTEAVVDLRGLEPGVYDGGRIVVRCLDCPPRCRQDVEAIRIRLEVTAPDEVADEGSAPTPPADGPGGTGEPTEPTEAPQDPQAPPEQPGQPPPPERPDTRSTEPTTEPEVPRGPPEEPRAPPERPPTDPPEEPCDCCCHHVQSWSAGEAIHVALASPDQPSSGSVASFDVAVGDRVPLAANAVDTDLLTITCNLEGCGDDPCDACSSKRVVALPGSVTYRWELLEGAGDLLSRPPYPHADSAIAEGAAAIYVAPERLPPAGARSVRIRLTVDDSPEYLADLDDAAVVRTIRFELVPRDQPTTVTAGGANLVRGSVAGAAPSDCDCQPEVVWRAESAIQPRQTPTSFDLCVDDLVVLEALASDVDRLQSRCRGDRCSSPATTLRLNDAMRYRFAPDAGRIFGGPAAEVVYRSPSTPGTRRIDRWVDDSGVHRGPADESELRLSSVQVRVFRVTILAAGDFIVPWSGENRIRYRLEPSPVDAVALEVYDEERRRVRRIEGLPTANDAVTGHAEFDWDGLDDAQRPLRQENAPFTLRLVARKGTGECRPERAADLKEWKFTFEIEDREPHTGAGASGIDEKTVIPTLLETKVQADAGPERRVPVYEVTEKDTDAEVTLKESFGEKDLFFLHTSPTAPEPIDYTITLLSREGGGLDEAGNEWDMDPAANGVQRQTVWKLRIDATGKVTLLSETITTP